jgi:2-methylcitrate dehydratase PrpD
MSPDAPPPVTEILARFATETRHADLPSAVRQEAVRAFVNWMGCVLGGSLEPAPRLASEVVEETGGRPQASLIGLSRRADVSSAAFINCISSSVLGYDDAHLATVTHPTGPVAAALFAQSEAKPVSGPDFLAALAVGMELECRLALALMIEPAEFNVGFYINGLVGPIGAAVAVGRVLGLDTGQMGAAIGIAASQGGGFRAVQGSMTSHFRPGHAARCGVWAAQLAAKGFTCTEASIEAPFGFASVFSTNAQFSEVTEDLGERFVLLSNAYKPYPCGIVIHPTIDACLEAREALGSDAWVSGETRLIEVGLQVHPLALSLTGKRTPAHPLHAQISLFHCAAAALLRGQVGIREMNQACIDDPEVAALRAVITAEASANLGKDEARVEIATSDGTRASAHVRVPRGSRDRPLTDAELDAKFMGQALEVIAPPVAESLLARCRNLEAADDVGRSVTSAWSA